MNVMECGKTLRENGVVIVEDFVDEELCDSLYEGISRTIENGEIDTVSGGEEDYDYGDLASWGDAVAKERTGRDEGMIDVFNIDQRIPEVDSFKNDDEILRTINEAASQPFSADNVNVYWNRSVTGTRKFHADTYTGKFKAFLYLTDVTDKSYGPFSYVEGSHKVSFAKKKASEAINKLQGQRNTDAVFYDDDDVVYCTAPKGSLIIANQGGYHRGYPQREGRERMLVTTSYTPES